MTREATDFTRMSQRELVFSFSLVTSLFFLWGFSYGLLDVLNQHFLDIFGLTKTQTTLLQFAYFVAYLVVAPPMGAFMRRFGYKTGIHVGLGLFSIGAVMFWPAAHYAYYGMFVAFTFVTASGLATLEVAANSYITVLGTPKYSALRLTLAQGFNGIATVLGPIIAAHAFFNGANEYSLGTVQYVYLAMSLFGCIINALVFFAKLPDVQQVVTVVSGAAEAEKVTLKGLLKYRRTIFGFLAEFTYVGAQVAVASFAIFYITEQPGISPAISQATASNMFSGCQGVFTAGRFIGVLYLRYVDPAFALFANGIGLMIFSILTAVLPGKGAYPSLPFNPLQGCSAANLPSAGIACLYLIFFFESICYPVIFSVATADLGTYAKLGAGLIAAGVSGGACWPSMVGAVADRQSTHIAFFLVFMGYVPLAAYGLVMWISRSHKYTGKITIWASQAPLAVPEAVEKALDAPEGEEAIPRDQEGKEEVSHAEFM